MSAVTLTWKSKTYTLTPHQGGYRLRSRARGNNLDLWGGGSPTAAKAAILAQLEGEHPKLKTADKVTLEEVIETYRDMPKRASARAAYLNECRLRAVVRTAWKKELKQVIISQVGPTLWTDFQRAKLGGRLDLATRRPGNAAINSAVRCAASIFIPKLRATYALAGIDVPTDATAIQWLPEMARAKSAVDGEKLLKAWKLETGPMFWTVGLARFAGLRQQEISACRRDWIVEMKGTVYVVLRDRPEQGFTHKTGETYFAPIINDDFAARLTACPEGLIVQTPDDQSRLNWFTHAPQKWLKPFTGAVQKPLHRLRGLYADDVAEIHRDAEAARLAGISAAAGALGHTNTSTTLKSYLSGPSHP